MSVQFLTYTGRANVLRMSEEELDLLFAFDGQAMNEELSNILEQSLRYASVLPLETNTPVAAVEDIGDGHVFQDGGQVPNDDDQLNNAVYQELSSVQKQTCEKGCMTESVTILDNTPITDLPAGINIRDAIEGNVTDLSQDNRICTTEANTCSLLTETLQEQHSDLALLAEATITHSLSGFSSTLLPGSDSSPSTSGFLNVVAVDDQASNINWETEHESTLHDTPSEETPPDLFEAMLVSDDSVQSTISSQIQDQTIEPVKVKVKRKRNRQKNPDLPPPVCVLPPCRICDEKSSGYHYGANTCEACKGFFRRTLKKKTVEFKCKCNQEEKEMWSRGAGKNGCPACRYERCIAVGMSKNAIKIGRYTLNHKTENIKEVKSLEAMDDLIQAAITNAAEQNPSSSLSYFESTSPVTDISAPATPCLDLEDEPGPFKKSRTETASNELSYAIKISLKEIDYIVKLMTDAQKKYHEKEENFSIDNIQQKQLDYAKEFHIKRETFGEMKTLSKEEYFDFYNATGIDIDGRRHQIETAMEFFEKKVSHLVTFVKSIPGFCELTLKDQANLIKASRLENMLVGNARILRKLVNVELKVLITPWGQPLHFSELDKLLSKSVIEQRLAARRLLCEIDLTEEETALLRALLVLFPDRCPLDEPEKVQALQDKLLSCLMHLVKIRPNANSRIWYKLSDLMIKLREITESDNKMTKELLADWPMLANYEFLREFIY